MFSDKFCLTQAVLDGTKTMTRRVLRDNVPLGNWEETKKHLPYKVGEVIAIAQPYKDIIKRLPMYSDTILGVDGMPRKEFKAGWTNKLFVKAGLIPHHIRITDVKVEYLQDISDDDILREGIYPQRFFNKVEYVFATKGKMNNTPVHRLKIFPTPREAFVSLIDKVSGNGTWESNPWVVAYSFELIN
jgi:hypothetical protein